jgi:hypothetical protein
MRLLDEPVGVGRLLDEPVGVGRLLDEPVGVGRLLDEPVGVGRLLDEPVGVGHEVPVAAQRMLEDMGIQIEFGWSTRSSNMDSPR